MKNSEYQKDFCKLSYVFIQVPSARERACDERTLKLTQISLLIIHVGYVLFCSLKIIFLALVSIEKVLSVTSLPFAYIILMSQDGMLLRMLDGRGFQTYTSKIKSSTSNCHLRLSTGRGVLQKQLFQEKCLLHFNHQPSTKSQNHINCDQKGFLEVTQSSLQLKVGYCQQQIGLTSKGGDFTTSLSKVALQYGQFALGQEIQLVTSWHFMSAQFQGEGEINLLNCKTYTVDQNTSHKQAS